MRLREGRGRHWGRAGWLLTPPSLLHSGLGLSALKVLLPLSSSDLPAQPSPSGKGGRLSAQPEPVWRGGWGLGLCPEWEACTKSGAEARLQLCRCPFLTCGG